MVLSDRFRLEVHESCARVGEVGAAACEDLLFISAAPFGVGTRVSVVTHIHPTEPVFCAIATGSV